MIYDGVFEPTTIEEWLENQKNKSTALNDDLFNFSKKYLLVDTYQDFINIRKNEILEEKNKSKTFKAPFIRRFFITQNDLAFNEDSYQYWALISFFSFLPRIIRRSDFKNSITFGLDDNHLEYAHKNFCHNLAFIDQTTFCIIKQYASIYFDWIQEQLKYNQKLKIERSMSNF